MDDNRFTRLIRIAAALSRENEERFDLLLKEKAEASKVWSDMINDKSDARKRRYRVIAGDINYLRVSQELAGEIVTSTIKQISRRSGLGRNVLLRMLDNKVVFLSDAQCRLLFDYFGPVILKESDDIDNG